MGSPRIIIVCGAGYVSGKEIMAIELGRGLTAAGHSPYFIASSWNNGDFPERLESNGLPFELMPLGFISARLNVSNLKMTGEQLLLWPRLMCAYRKMLKRERPSTVIHTNWHHLVLLWSYLKPERDLFWVHETLPSTRRYARLFNNLEHRIRCFVCVSNAVAKSLRNLGISTEKIRVLHNGLRDPVIPNNGARGAESPMRFGVVGQIGAWKGHEDVIDAVAEATRKGAKLRLEIFGEGDASFVLDLKKKANDLGISEALTWHGFERDRARIYTGMDVCVVPSRSHDPLPTTAIEAGLFGLPVIATNMGGLPEIVEDGMTGILVEPKSPSQIVDAIWRFIDQPALRESMGKASRQRALERFGCDRFIREFIDIINVDAGKESHATMY